MFTAADILRGLEHALSPAQLLGWLAFALGVACFLQKSDLRFKVFMALECSAYVLHFSALGQWAAAASAAVSVGRSVASVRYSRPLVGVGFMLLSTCMGVWLSHSWVSWLPIVASVVGTYALFFLKGLRMRQLMLVGTGLWLVHNAWVGSIGGFCLELVIALTNLTTMWRLVRTPSAD